MWRFAGLVSRYNSPFSLKICQEGEISPRDFRACPSATRGKCQIVTVGRQLLSFAFCCQGHVSTETKKAVVAAKKLATTAF